MEDTQIEVPTKVGTEPALTVAGILSLLGATFVLIGAFFPGLLTQGQEEAIGGFLAIALPLVGGFIVRRKVTANANVVERISKSGFIVAGEANEMLETGSRIRVLTQPQPRRAEEDAE